MAEQKLQLVDWLDDLCVRFILNLPEDDLSSVARICFQVEEAQWFYEDFIRALDPTLPSMSLRSFCLRIFKHCPLLASFSVENHLRAYAEFLTYKTRIPVRGAILLNHAMDSTILVKGWKKGANWSFPRGKINKDEDDLVCAIREVYEETGLDLKDAGLIPKGEDVKYIEISIGHQQIRLYVFRDVPMDTVFEPKTRKEISKVQWYRLSELPAFRKKGIQQDNTVVAMNTKKFYMVAPFLVPLKKWVVAQKKKDAAKCKHLSAAVNTEAYTEDDIGNRTEAAVEVPEDIGNRTEAAVEVPEDIGNRTEAAAEVPEADSSIEIQKAELEIRRLLKLPRFTQAVQPTIKDALKNDAQALMEILQSGGIKKTVDNGGDSGRKRSPTTLATQIPHTPIESTSQLAEPKTPHHHHPTSRLGALATLPPPSFSLSPRALSSQHCFATYHPPGFNDAAPHPADATAQNSANRRQHTVILHAQPLPPPVQTDRLAKKVGPDLSEAISKLPAQLSQHLTSSLSGMTTGRQITGNELEQQATYAASTTINSTSLTAAASATPQLSPQQMSLLRAFKDRTSSKQKPGSMSAPLVTDLPTGRSFPGELPTKQSSQAAGPPLQAPADKAVPPNYPNLLSLLNPGKKMSAAQPAIAGGAANSSHRAGLLDLSFVPSTPTTVADGMIKPAKTADPCSISSDPGMENAVPKLPAASGDKLGSRSKVNSNPVPAGTGNNMSVPTRSYPGNGTLRFDPPYFVYPNGCAILPYARDCPRDSGNTQNSLPASQKYPALLRRRPNARGPAPESREPSRVTVPDHITKEDKQLLAFLKATPAAALTTSVNDSVASSPQVPSLPLPSEHTQNGDTGSLLGSRRGSQTPNTPEQKFLLNYLMSKSGVPQN